MKKMFFVLLITLSCMSFKNPSTSSEEVATGNIKVTINGIENKKGQIVFMLFNSNDGFPSETGKAFKKGIVKTFSTNATFTFEDVPHGSYAIAVFHDEDGNGEIKKNWIGMPKEPVGSSNLTKMSKPNFKKCKFQLDASELTIDMIFII